MSYDDVKKDFVKEKFFVVELDLDYCNLEYGVGACTAAIGVTGTQKCFNTAKQCQDRANYDKGTKTYRFCTKRSPVPVGLDAIPSLKGAPSFDGAKINPKGGLGVRGGVTLNFLDQPSSDVGIDPYVDERAYIPYDTGTYWGKLRARNPFYNNRSLRAYSGYLVDGVYDPLNFQSRSYVTEVINSNRGGASITGKDVLKLADDDRAQYPPKSTGVLVADIDSVVTSITLSPIGVGDSEYGISGWVRIGDEVMSFTRAADVMLVNRARYETLAIEHGENDSVQECAYLNDTVANIDYLLLTQGAKVDPAFIDLPTWQTESDFNYPYLLETLLTEPIGVQKLLKELGENAPHFLYFDERLQEVIFTAVKEPPISVNVINNQDHILKDSFRTADAPKSRLSDVLIYFGQRDPTKKMDELNNYNQSYIRSDLSSSGADEYDGKKIKTIYSRWLNNFNKAGALVAGERIGRRFGITPRQVSFKMTSKDSDYWVGDEIGIDHPVLQTATGETGGNIYQITSVKEAGDFEYSALEYLYSTTVPGDPDEGELIILGGDDENVNLRTVYDNLFPAPTASTVVKFSIDGIVTIGSAITAAHAIDTGTWPTGAIVTLQTAAGAFVVGRGGDGGGVSPFSTTGEDGGPAITLSHDLTLINNGVIGGGGGGGGGFDGLGGIGGSGGAGIFVGLGYDTGDAGSGINGTKEFGGAAVIGNAGAGGDLGQNGEDGDGISIGGLAGNAINKNGFVLTETVTGDIRGTVI